VCILSEHEDGTREDFSYAQLQRAANRFSHVLRGLGVARGDRVAIVMPQRFETAATHMALYQLGAVAMPLSMLFGPEALEFRLRDSGARVAVVDEHTVASLRAVRAQCPGLAHVVAVGGAQGQGDLDWADALAEASAQFKPVATRADDPAVLIYTSGTTGAPKGALIPHRALIGNLTGFVCSQNWFPHVEPLGDEGRRPVDEAVFWSPADWAWTGGLMDALLPALYFGRPIVAYQGRFSAEMAFGLLQRHRVTHSFLFPTPLKAMMKAVPRPLQQYQDRKSTRLNSSHNPASRMPSSA
jgi:acetyl-CoA synthetase